MTKTFQKNRPAGANKTSEAATSKSAAATPDPTEEGTPAAMPAAPGGGGGKSKQDLVIEMLQRDEGASIDDLAEATGWQKHSVRGMMSGALKKKLGLNIVKTTSGETTTYRIVATDGEVANAG